MGAYNIAFGNGGFYGADEFVFVRFYFKTYKDFLKFSKTEILKLCFLTLIIIISGSYYPFILDHFGYYVPSINWLSEFGLSKGLANLNLI